MNPGASRLPRWNMKVNVKITGFLRRFTENQDVIELTGNTVGECLASLESRFPEINQWLHDAKGNLHTYIWLVLNGQYIYPDDLATPLNDGDEILITLAVGGG